MADGKQIFTEVMFTRIMGCDCDVIITIEPDGSSEYTHEETCASLQGDEK